MKCQPFDSPARFFDCTQNTQAWLAFRQTFRQAQGRECTERLKAPSYSQGAQSACPAPAYRQAGVSSGISGLFQKSRNASSKRGRGDFSRLLNREAKASPTHSPRFSEALRNLKILP